MAQGKRATQIVPSILDRLLDNAPASTEDPPSTMAEDLERFKTAVRRDLEVLLNTRRESTVDLSAYPQVQHSLVAYGLPDFTSFSAQNEGDRQRMREAIGQAIEHFEPRLLNADVQIVTGEAGGHQLSFRVDALLRVDPVPAPVTFDAVLQVSTQHYQVKG